MSQCISDRRIDAVRFTISPKLAYVSLAGLAAAGLSLVYVTDPSQPNIYPVCPFFGLTGCYCPGCGTLRAIHQLLHGNLSGAVGYNLFAVASLPFIAYSFAAGALRAFHLRGTPAPIFVPHRLIWALLAAIIAFWVLRNLPVGPFAVLAP